MKSKSYKNSREEKNNLWDAFTDYLENIYFPGASELLDRQTIAFEYEAFKTYFAQGQYPLFLFRNKIKLSV